MSIKLSEKNSSSSESFLEAQTYYNLKILFTKEQHLHDKVIIVSRDWIQKWKIYSSYDAYKSKKHQKRGSVENADKSERPKVHPGPIDNTSIIMPLDEFFNDGDADKRENMILKEEVSARNKKIKRISVDSWNFLFKIYGGGPAITKDIVDYKTKSKKERIVLLFEKQIQLVVFPLANELSRSTIDGIKIERAFLNRHTSLDNLKRIIQSTLKARGLGKVSQIKIWKFDTSLELNEIKMFLLNNAEKIKNGEKFNVKEFIFFGSVVTRY